MTILTEIHVNRQYDITTEKVAKSNQIKASTTAAGNFQQLLENEQEKQRKQNATKTKIRS